MQRNVIDVLKERGFIDAMTHEELRDVANQPLSLYCGFDPTADCLHLGNLVPIMGLAWFQKFGHRPVALVGGATGMIGDPSGKSSERQLLDEQTIEGNLVGIRQSLEQVLKKIPGSFRLLNNYDWFKDFSFIGFLRDWGKYFRIGIMLSKESVKARLQSEDGMSFTEFAYQVLQGYDFLHLFEKEGVKLQLGGQDQWGNITAGTELIRKVKGESAYGLTFPLLLRSDGKKFGKSEKGSIWLSAEKLSPYEFYQYLVRVPDADVITLLKMLTFLEMDDIRDLEKQMTASGYEPNTVQKRLAEEVTRIIHGEEGVAIAKKVTEAAAPGQNAALDGTTLETLARDMPSHTLPVGEAVGKKIVDVMAAIGISPSRGEAKRLLKNGGVYLNNVKVEDENAQLETKDLIEGRLVLLAAGKKNKVLLRLL